MPDTCRWLTRPNFPSPGVLLLNGTEYSVLPVHDTSRRKKSDPPPPIVAWRLTNLESCQSYLVSCGEGPWDCDCGDATHRHPGNCKHVRALRAALVWLEAEKNLPQDSVGA